MNVFRGTLTLLLLCGAFMAQAGEEPVLRVFASIVPEAYFAERIGGGRVAVSVVVQPGQNPATYEPTPRQMAELSRAHALLCVNVPVERAFVDKIRRAVPGLRLIDLTEGVRLRRMEGHSHAHGEAHGATEGGGGEGGGHADIEDPPGMDEGPDPHIWLSPLASSRMCRTIARAFSEMDPEGRSGYEVRLQSVLADLDALHERISRRLEGARGSAFVVFHPAWGYFADAYGLRQIPIEAEGKAPGARQLAACIDRVRREGCKAIFTQAEFDQRPARAVAEALGVKAVVLDPMARDYIANMDKTSEIIASSLGAPGTPGGRP